MSIRSIITVCLAALLAACAAGRRPLPPAKHPLQVAAFPGGSNWPVWVAMDKGYFAAEKLRVTVTPTPDSTFQMRGLIQGDFDVAITSMDDVVAPGQLSGDRHAHLVGLHLAALQLRASRARAT